LGQSAPRVLLLSMPWTSLTEPSLGLGILNARLRQDGIPCRVRHLNIFLLKYLKASSYAKIADLYAFNDFLFTNVLEGGDASADQMSALRKMICEEESQELASASDLLNRQSYAEYSNRVRNCIVPQYLADCMELVRENHATMIGFTCIFDQTIASLALAKLIKHEYPEKLIVFGGYAIERPVGAQILSSFPFVDAISTMLPRNITARIQLLHTPRLQAGVDCSTSGSDDLRSEPHQSRARFANTCAGHGSIEDRSRRGRPCGLRRPGGSGRTGCV